MPRDVSAVFCCLLVFHSIVISEQEFLFIVYIMVYAFSSFYSG